MENNENVTDNYYNLVEMFIKYFSTLDTSDPVLSTIRQI